MAKRRDFRDSEEWDQIRTAYGLEGDVSADELRATLEGALAAQRIPTYARTMASARRRVARRTDLIVTSEESAPIVIALGGPSLLVAVTFHLMPTSFGGWGTLALPTLDQIEVKFEIGTEKKGLSSQEDRGPEPDDFNGYAPCATFDLVKSGSILNTYVDGERGEIRATFRGAYAGDGASGFPRDLRIAAVAYSIPWSPCR